MEKLGLYLALFMASLSAVVALECYTCDDEKRNRGACNKNTMSCAPFQDACTSYVRWGIPPSWTPRGDRRYYISKGCDTMQGCTKRQEATDSTCNRDWYNDWACVECCFGDLCNYFITEGAGSIQVSMLTLAAGTLLALFAKLVL